MIRINKNLHGKWNLEYTEMCIYIEKCLKHIDISKRV